MARKKATLRRRKAAPSFADRLASLDTIQWAGISIVVVLLAVGAWFLVRSLQGSKPAAAAPTVAGSAKQWSSPPPMTIDKSKQYFATVKMAKGGQFVMQLYPDKAPVTVNSFVFLARQGFYNGVTFHRVIDGFMAQAGDPTGTGTGGPGYQFANENSDLTFDKAGVVAMANASRPNTNGSQFFITFGPQTYLNGGYTIFGQVISGMDVVNGLTRRNPDDNPPFPGDAIQTVTIEVK